MKPLHRRRRQATTLTELLIAASLIATLAVTYLPMLKKVSGFQRQLELQRLAIDELSNQLETLVTLSDDDWLPALANLQPSAEAKSRLDGVQLDSEIVPLDGGSRIELRITWKERQQVPLRLATWRAAATGDSPPSTVPDTSPVTPQPASVPTSPSASDGDAS